LPRCGAFFIAALSGYRGAVRPLALLGLLASANYKDR
jgi:hypothetical protein